MESKSSKTNEMQVIVFPYPIQGHINPMLQLSKQLASRGLKVTLVTTSSYSSKLKELQSRSITIETIADGNDEATTASNADAQTQRFDDVGRKSLAQLIQKKIGLLGHNNNIKCLIYDSSITWALDVAKKFGIYGASYCTQSCLVSLIYYQVYKGILSAPIKEPKKCVDELPLIEVENMPSFVREVGVYPTIEKIVVSQFSNIGDADWRFFNSFDCLESEIL
ncbi:UDP-glycosyltransferase 74G1 [Bienertia sinuspersici]